MGLTGILLSSGAGGLSIVFSVLAIRRRRRRRRKAKHSQVSTELCRTSDECTTATCQRNPVFIKATTTEPSSKRGAVAVHSHVVTTDRFGTWHTPVVPAAYKLHGHKDGEAHILSFLTVAGEASKWNPENAKSRIIKPESCVPMKEYTTSASKVTDTVDPWEESHESLCFPTTAVVNDDWTSSESGSETESCSFIDDDSLSAEELLRSTEDDNNMEENANILRSSQPSQRVGKRVSFQIGHQEGQGAILHHTGSDHLRPVSTDFTSMHSLAQADEITSPSWKAEETPPRYADSEPLFPISYNTDSRNAEPAPVIHDAVFPNQEANNSVECREVALPSLRSEDHNLLEVKKSPYVSVEPLAHVSALDDVLTGSPLATAPIIVREPKFPTSPAPDFASVTEKGPKPLKELESQEAMSLRKIEDKAVNRSSDEEKENAKASLSSTPEKLSRKARQMERPGMFRRSSHPSLKRFRFPDRIKVRPLRNSSRNSK